MSREESAQHPVAQRMPDRHLPAIATLQALSGGSAPPSGEVGERSDRRGKRPLIERHIIDALWAYCMERGFWARFERLVVITGIVRNRIFKNV